MVDFLFVINLMRIHNFIKNYFDNLKKLIIKKNEFI